MENNHVEHKEERNSLHQMMQDTIDQIHGMADSNAVVGQPIHTPDGVTLIPISRVSFGFGNGGGSTYGKHQPNKENLTFATGGAVTVVLILHGWSAPAALLVAVLAGLAAGVWSGTGELRRLWRCDTAFSPAMPPEQRERLLEQWHRAVGRCRGWIC